MTAAALGATGFVGRALVSALAARGEVVAVSRRATALELPGVCSVADGGSTRGALEGVDVAYVVVGRGSAAFETIVALVDRLPVMVAPRWVSTPTQPIALTDMVRYLTSIAGRTETLGASFDVGGPEVITYGDMIQGIARLRGKRRLIVEVPVLSPRLSSYWPHLVTPVGARVARPLVEGVRTRRPRATTGSELAPVRRRNSVRARADVSARMASATATQRLGIVR